MTPFPIYRRLSGSGDSLSTSETNQLLDYLEQRDSSPPANSELFRGMNGQPQDIRQPEIWGKLTRQRIGNRYGWVQCYVQDDGTIVQGPAEEIMTNKGTPDEWPAIEVNANTRIREGTVVRLVQGVGPWVEFEYATEDDGYPYPYGGSLNDGNGGSAIKHRAMLNIGCDATSGKIVGDLVEYTVVGLLRRNRLFLSISMEVIEEDKVVVPTDCKEVLVDVALGDVVVTCVDGVITVTQPTLTKTLENVRVVVCGSC